MKGLLFAALTFVATPCAAQQFDFPAAAAKDPAVLSAAMPKLASQAIAVYREGDRRTYLDNLFRLQIVAGRYTDATKSLAELHALRLNSASPQSRATDLQYDIYAQARAAQKADGLPFNTAFERSFREIFGRLDDRTSALVIRAIVPYSPGISLHVPIEDNLRAALATQKGKPNLSLTDALALIHTYQEEESYKAFAPFVAPLIAEDDRRRYVIEQSLVPTAPGAGVCVLVVRPRGATERLPTLLEFTIYADPEVYRSEARRSASNGYIGVEGLTRGKGCSPGKTVPNQFDGADAAALIGWISRQSWSDGRVGMYGGSYSGFTQWAAAKHMPPALKAIMPAVTEAPGIDFPMEGSVVETFNYYWPFYTTNNKTVDDAAFNDRAHWRNLFRKWYLGGRAYRDLDQIDGAPNPVWDNWVSHNDYDAYWQAMISFRDEFAAIRIPVLTTTGYYDGGEIGALYYLTEHYKYNPAAEHYLVIGPYDHHSGNRGTIDVLGDELGVLNGYDIDPVAHIDLGELRFQWFDYIFKGGPKPAILQDRVNYEVMGANIWKHAPSLAAMADRKLRFYLDSARVGQTTRLTAQKPAEDTFIPLTVDLADRKDVDRMPPGGDILDKAVDTWDGLEFVSDPMTSSAEMSGLFSGQLDFVCNKKDIDFYVQLYELTPKGEYLQLSSYLARASYVRDRTHRQLLTPGVRQNLPFTSGRLISRLFEPGSRLVMVLSIVKEPGIEINYGSGKNVADETIADAGAPLQIKWFGDSFIDVPISK